MPQDNRQPARRPIPTERLRQDPPKQTPPRRAPLDEPTLASEAQGLVNDVLGKDEWKSSKRKYIMGTAILGAGTRALKMTFGSAGGRAMSLYRAAIGRGQDDGIPAVLDQDPARRFAESMRVHGKTTADLDKILVNTFRSFWLFASLVFLVLVAGTASLFWSPPASMALLPFDLAFRFVVLAPLGAFALRSAYTNWMVYRRRYDGFVRFIRSGEWLPRRPKPPTASGGRKVAIRAALFLAIALGGFAASSVPATPVFAQTQQAPSPTGYGPQDIFKVPPNSDLFLTLLSFIAPNVGPIPAMPAINGVAGGTTPAHEAMAAAFMAFISALMFLAGLQISWHTLSGIVATAQEGKVLGQRWHQVWAPVRVVSGVGFLAPVAHGYCAAQLVVLYLIVFGGQLANLLWTPFVQSLTSGVAATNQVEIDQRAQNFSSLSPTNEVLQNVFKKELCYAIIQANYNRRHLSGPQTQSVLPQSLEWKLEYEYPLIVGSTLSKAWDWFMNTAGGGQTASTTLQRGWAMNYGDVCGKMTLAIVSQNQQAGTTSDPSIDAAVKFGEARMEAINNAIAIMRPLAVNAAQTYENYQAASAGTVSGLFFSPEYSQQNGAQGGQGSIDQAVQAFTQARNAYETRMITAAKDVLTAAQFGSDGNNYLTQFKQSAIDGGWATAGVYYMTISRIQSSIFAAATEKPEFTNVQTERADERLRPTLEGDQANNSPGALQQFDQWWGTYSTQILGTTGSGQAFKPIDPKSARAGASAPALSGPLGWVMDKLSFKDGSSSIMQVKINPMNAMGDIMWYGHTIIDLAYAGLAAMFVVTGIAGVLTAPANFLSGGMISSLIGIVLTFGMMLGLAILALGVMLAYILPMIPYIMVMFFIAGMLVLTIEALIAAPLWAFFHVRMDGQEFIDQVQRPGYMIAFNLLLRPSLMLLGLFMSFFCFGALSWFISVTYSAAISAATAGFFAGPIGFLVLGGIYVYLNYQAAVRSFHLITQVPDRVTRWFGMGGEHLGEEGQAEKATGLVLAQVSQRTESLARTPGAFKLGQGAGGGGGPADKGAAQGALASPGGGGSGGGGAGARRSGGASPAGGGDGADSSGAARSGLGPESNSREGIQTGVASDSSSASESSGRDSGQSDTGSGQRGGEANSESQLSPRQNVAGGARAGSQQRPGSASTGTRASGSGVRRWGEGEGGKS